MFDKISNLKFFVTITDNNIKDENKNCRTNTDRNVKPYHNSI